MPSYINPSFEPYSLHWATRFMAIISNLDIKRGDPFGVVSIAVNKMTFKRYTLE